MRRCGQASTHLLVRLIAVLLAVAGLQLVTVASGSGRAQAATVTGAGGLFVPAEGRLFWASQGIGTGGSKGQLSGGQWYAIQAGGVAGIPATGADSVQITITAESPAAAGAVRVSTDEDPTKEFPALFYNAGVQGTVSNTAIVALADDGTFGLLVDTSTDLIVDVQGYYTSGEAAAGGYVASQSPQRIVDTRISGTGLPQGQLASGSISTVTVGGHAGVPVGASAAFVNFEIVDYSSGGYLIPYRTGDAVPNYSLDFPGNVTTSLSQVVPLDSQGRFNVKTMTNVAASRSICWWT